MKNGQQFCSKACVGAAKRHGSMLVCPWCDTEFYRRFGEQDRKVRAHQFCSTQCYGAWRAQKRRSYPKHGARHRHRVVAEQFLGRKLNAAEVVHHIDHDKQNCRPANLAVFPSQAEHARCHFGKKPASWVQQFSLEAIAKRERGDALS
jgi:hypothetical protein